MNIDINQTAKNEWKRRRFRVEFCRKTQSDATKTEITDDIGRKRSNFSKTKSRKKTIEVENVGFTEVWGAFSAFSVYIKRFIGNDGGIFVFL